jgi:hypothetical protein
MKRKVLIPINDESPKRRTGGYNLQESARHALAFEKVNYHPNKPILGFVDGADRYTEALDWGHVDGWGDEAVMKTVHAIAEIPMLGDIVIQQNSDWSETDEAIQIGVLWPNARVPQGVFMRGLGCAPKHRMKVCVKTVSPRAAHDFQAELMGGEEERKNAVHTRLSQVMHRLLAFVANCDVRDAGAFGIEGEEESLESFLRDCMVHEGAKWGGRVFAPARCQTDIVNTQPMRRGWAMGEQIWTDNPAPWDAHPPAEEQESPAPTVVREHPPIYKEKRTSLHIDLGGDFWVEETRCPSCAQRLIIHAPASMCPSGRPVGLTVKCGDCKHSFGWP